MLSFKDLKKNLKKEVSAIPELKVALLGDTATQLLSIALRGMAIERGIRLNLFESDYNQIERLILDTQSELYAFEADYIIIFQSTQKLLNRYNSLPFDNQSVLSKERLDFLKQACELFSSKLIVLNYPEIEDGVFGNFSNKISSSFIYQLRKLNYELMNLAQEAPNLFICDFSALQNKYGRDVVFDTSIYVSTDMVLSLDILPCISSRIMDIICALEGKFKKCVILDLDNTLWGGVIGDDGIENIQLGSELGIGKVFIEFQQWLLKLKNRGIILAVCSKNDENVAKEPFMNHPDMVLKLDDISLFIANWENKADNIRQIQQALNIHFDSMVFLDDNPFERNIVRENIADITVPELPEDPAEYLEYLYSLNLFETVSYSETDIDRTKQYQVEAQRVLLQNSFTNEVDFLKSLNMVSEVKAFDAFTIPRVAQLSQRSNQFNLRTIRYTEAEIKQIAEDAKYHPFAFTLSDKYGDNGLISVIILEEKDKETLFIDTWFMSCRVLKRGMESFALNVIVEYAKKRAYKYLIGEYIPTQKNGMVESHYLNIGFDQKNNHVFLLNMDNYVAKTNYIKLLK